MIFMLLTIITGCKDTSVVDGTLLYRSIDPAHDVMVMKSAGKLQYVETDHIDARYYITVAGINSSGKHVQESLGVPKEFYDSARAGNHFVYSNKHYWWSK
jgi:hypothetical protein